MKAVFSMCIVVIPALIFGYLKQPTEMGLAIVAGAIGACFLNLDRIQRFRGAGFEAEMQRAVEEAYATINNLKEVAKPLILSTLQILTFNGRWGGIHSQEEHNIKGQLDSICKSLSLDDKDIQSASEQFHRYNSWDHYGLFVEALSNQKIDSDKIKKLSKFKDYKSCIFPSEEDILVILESPIEQLDLEVQDRFKDYLFYLANNKLAG